MLPWLSPLAYTILPSTAGGLGLFQSYSFFHCLDAFIRVILDIFTPETETQNGPVPEEQRVVIFPVTFHVPGNFLIQYVLLLPFSSRSFSRPPVFAVEELAVAKNGNAVLRQDNVRRARKLLVIFPVAVSLMPHGLTQNDLYGSVL